MDNAQKAIMIGVGLFITIIIISAVLLIVNLGTSLVDESTARLDAISSSLQATLTDNYDGRRISGARVLSAIKEYANDSQVSVVVLNDAGAIVARTGAFSIEDIAGVVGTGNVTLDDELREWGTAGIGERTPIREFSSTLEPEYINPAIQYDASVVRNADGAVVGIAFQPN